MTANIKEHIAISIFKVPQRTVLFIPPLIKLEHSDIEICFVFICLKQLINMIFNYVFKIGKRYGDAGDWTPGLSHAKRTLYHWATSPSFLYWDVNLIHFDIRYIRSQALIYKLSSVGTCASLHCILTTDNHIMLKAHTKLTKINENADN